MTGNFIFVLEAFSLLLNRIYKFLAKGVSRCSLNVHTQPKNWGNFNPRRGQTSMAEDVLHFTQEDETCLLHGARGSVPVKALCYKPEGRGFDTRWGEWIFSIYRILPAALVPAVHSASNKNEFQKQKNVSREYSVAGAYGWQPHRLLWADCLENVGSLTLMIWILISWLFLNCGMRRNGEAVE
jgi:hypothetical protein